MNEHVVALISGTSVTGRTKPFFPELNEQADRRRPGPRCARPTPAGERVVDRATEMDRRSSGDVSAGVSHGGF